MHIVTSLKQFRGSTAREVDTQHAPNVHREPGQVTTAPHYSTHAIVHLAIGELVRKRALLEYSFAEINLISALLSSILLQNPSSPAVLRQALKQR